MTTRRDLFRMALGAAAAAAAFDRTALTARAQAPPPAPAAGPFTLAPLPYAADALEPYIDAQTMTIHHDRHHQAYVNNLNAALKDHPDLQKLSPAELVSTLDALPPAIRTAVRNNGGGHLNHDIFWTTMKKGGGAATGDLAAAIAGAFGGHDKWQETMARTAMGVFGSGWAWLAWDPAKKALVVEPYPNQDTPAMQGKVPLVGVDVWEHAYYLKYQNRRRDYVDAWFNVIDWGAVSARFEAARKA